MTEFDLHPSNGVFDPPALRNLAEAFEKAERHLDRLRYSAVAEVDRDRVARRIVSEARDGEMQPDLVWRAAIAKVLLEVQANSSKDGRAPTERSVAGLGRGRRESASAKSHMPPAGPHAAPQHTNQDATPGAGALPTELPGDDVDPATG